MLTVASVGGATVEPATNGNSGECNLDRAGLRSLYERALENQARGKHLEALDDFGSCLCALPAPGAGGGYDNAWAHGFRGLCLRNQALSYWRSSNAALALANLRQAVSLGSPFAEDASLWRMAAECAAESEDWHAARITFERSLAYWPKDPELLRGLARTLLQIGDIGACRACLQELETATNTNLRKREAWMLDYLCSHRWGTLALPPSDLDNDSREALNSYNCLSATRAKRLRTENILPSEEPARACVKSPSLSFLLHAALELARRGTGRTQIAVFEVAPAGSVAEHAGITRAPVDNRPGGAISNPPRAGRGGPPSGEMMETQSAVWSAVRSLAVNPWDLSQSGLEWAVMNLEESAAKISSPDESEIEEIREVATFLKVDSGLDGTDANAPNVSCERDWHSWLHAILTLAIAKLDVLKPRRDSRRLFAVISELAVCFVLLSVPNMNRFTIGKVLKKPWLSKARSHWLCAEESCPPHKKALKSFIREQGLAMAEICAASGATELMHVGLDFLRAWLRLGCDCLPDHLAAWLQEASRQPSRMDTYPPLPAALTEEGTTLQPSAACTVLRWIWASRCLLFTPSETQLWERKTLKQWTIFATELCEIAGKSPGQQGARTCLGESVSAQRCAPRIVELPQDASAGQANTGQASVSELAQQVMSVWLPPPSEALVSSDVVLFKSFLAASESVIDKLSAGMEGPSPKMARQDTNSSGQAQQDAETAKVLETLTWILCQLAISLGRFTLGGASGLKSDRADMLTKVLRHALEVVAHFERSLPFYGNEEAAGGAVMHAGFSPDNAPLLLGITLGGATGRGTAHLSPALERLLLAALVISTCPIRGETQAPGLEADFGRGDVTTIDDEDHAWSWLPLQHAALCFGVRVFGVLLLSPPTATPARFPLLSIDPDGNLAEKDSSARISAPRKTIWANLCAVLEATHDLSLQLPESYFLQRETSVATSTTLLFSGASRRPEEFNARMCAGERTLLSMPHLLLSCALRMDCSTLAAWRGDMSRWLATAGGTGSAVVESSQTRSELANDADSSDSNNDVLNVLRASEAEQGNNLPWRRSIRALRAADGKPPPEILEGKDKEIVDVAICKVAARGLACLCAMDSIDPDPPASIKSRGIILCRFLSDPNAYNFRVRSGDEPLRKETPATLLDMARALRDRVSEYGPPPHILALAALAHCTLRQGPGGAAGALGRATRAGSRTCWPTPASAMPFTDQFKTDVASRLDIQLFGRLPPKGQKARNAFSRFMFNPVVIPMCIFDLVKDCSGTMPANIALKPVLRFFEEIMALKPLPDEYPVDLMMGAGDLPEALRDVDNALKRLAAKEFSDMPLHKVLFKMNAQQFVRVHDTAARELLSGLEKSTSLTLPQSLRQVYVQILASTAFQRMAASDTLALAFSCAKNVAIHPVCWETWSCVASCAKRVFLLQDERYAGDEDWSLTVQHHVARQQSTLSSWPSQLHKLHAHARSLAVGLKLQFEVLLEKGLLSLLESLPLKYDFAEAADADTREQVSQCRQYATHWLSRSMDLHQLLRFRLRSLCLGSLWTRKRAVAAAGEKPGPISRREDEYLFILRSCDAVCRQVLWFLAHCSDMAPHLQASLKVIKSCGNAWPLPVFGPCWQSLTFGRGMLPLIEFKTGAAGPFPQMLWYVPCMAARWQWNFHAIGLNDVPVEGLLKFLLESSSLENMLRRLEIPSQTKAPADGGAPPQVSKKCSTEPHWRTVILRMNVLQEMPEKWESMAECNFSGDAAAKKPGASQVLQDCLGGLTMMSCMDAFYSGKFVFKKARQAELSGDLSTAISEIESIFAWPKHFPKQGVGKVGLRLYRVTEEGASHSENPHPDPWREDRLQIRSFNNTRAKALFFILDMQRKVLTKFLHPNAVGGSMFAHEPDTPNLTNVKESGIYWHSDAKKAAQHMTTFQKKRPTGWNAIAKITGLLLALVRGLKGTSDSNFWSAFHDAFGRALRQTFAVLVKAGHAERKPHYDWEMMALVRSYWIFLESDQGPPAEVRKLVGVCYVSALDHMRNYASFRLSSVPPSVNAVCPFNCAAVGSKLRARVEYAEGVYQSLLPFFPKLEGFWGSSDERKDSASEPVSTNFEAIKKGNQILLVDSDMEDDSS